MDKAKSLSQQFGVTRGKLIVIAVLAVTLVGVLYVQYGKSKPAAQQEPQDLSSQEAGQRPASRASRAKRQTPVTAAIVADAMPVLNPVLDHRAWKTPELAIIIKHDPFALPSAFPQPAVAASAQPGASGADAVTDADQNRLADTVAKLQSELEQLKQRGVHVIIREGDQYVALIGDRTIHVGEEYEGFTVTAIRPDGVQVERKVQP